MRVAKWDDPSLRYDDVNFYWGDPSYVLEPGDPGYQPPTVTPPPAAPPPKKKPFRRKTAALEKPTEPNSTNQTIMSTFQYNIAPLSSGGFTTRAVRGEAVAEATLTQAIAQATGTTPETVAAVIQAFGAQILQHAAVSNWSPSLYGCFTFRPTSGGKGALPTDFHNAADINADVALSLTPDKIADWQAGLSLENLGEVGKLTPMIDSIINLSNNGINTYSAGHMIQLRGERLRLEQGEVAQGVFFTPVGGGTEVRATVYGPMEPGNISVLVPATLTGPQSVRIAAKINGSVRSYTYTTPITA